MINVLNTIPLNIVCGVLGATLAILIGTSIRDVGLRNYLFILISAVLITASMIEHFFLHLSLLKSGALGWIIGWIADDVIMSMNVLLPEFMRHTVNDFFQSARKIIQKFLRKFE